MMTALKDEYPNIEYLRHPVDIGAKENFRRLITSVDTRYFLVMSDDDFLIQGHIRSGIEKLELYGDIQSYMSATITANLITRSFHRRNQAWIEGIYSPTEQTARRLIKEHFTLTGTIYRTETRDLFTDFPPLGDDEVSCVLLGGVYKHYISPRIGAVWTINERRPLLYSARRGTRRQLLNSYEFATELIEPVADYRVRAILMNFLFQYYLKRFRLREIYIFRRRQSAFGKGVSRRKILFEVRLLLTSITLHVDSLLKQLTGLLQRYKSLITRKDSDKNSLATLRAIPRAADSYLVNAEICDKQQFLDSLDGFLRYPTTKDF